MSHFSVLVVGNVDYNMAPFHEFECDGVDDEFIQTIDITDKKYKEFLDAKKEYQECLKSGKEPKYQFTGDTFEEYLKDYCGFKIAESANSLDLEGDHKYGYAYPYKDGEKTHKVFDRTNPNKFYDYYGGGYNAFKLKTPKADGTVYVNHALKKDIDFEGKWAESDKEARKTYRKVIKALGYTPKLERTWSSLVDRFHPSDGKEPSITRQEAEILYDAQQAVKDWKKAWDDKKLTPELVGFWGKVDDFAMTEDEYVASQSIHSLSYGYVINREYHSRGEMGWWGMSFGEKEPTTWDEEYKKFIESLPDDAELTMLDCHI